MTIEGERILLTGQDIKATPMQPRKVKTLQNELITVFRFSMKQRSHAKIEKVNACVDESGKPRSRYVRDAILELGAAVGGNQADLKGWSKRPMPPIERGGPAQKRHPGHYTKVEPAALVVEQVDFPALEEMVILKSSLKKGMLGDD